jgi:hypothetical protein
MCAGCLLVLAVIAEFQQVIDKTNYENRISRDELGRFASESVLVSPTLFSLRFVVAAFVVLPCGVVLSLVGSRILHALGVADALVGISRETSPALWMGMWIVLGGLGLGFGLGVIGLGWRSAQSEGSEGEPEGARPSTMRMILRIPTSLLEGVASLRRSAGPRGPH